MRLRLFLFRSVLLLFVLMTIEFAGYAGMWLSSRSSDFLSNKNYFRIRDMLIGNKDPEHFPRYLSLPYLGYIPYPGYRNHGEVQHNEDGYRGRRIPLQKSNKLRVLCLGGSTTYGLGVDSPSQTFPALIERLLNDFIPHDSILSAHYSGAEVINAGLEAGTSAEELQQYLFKYSYYQPDVVIVNSGVNDALLTASIPSNFQLDYTHYRRINFHLEPLPPPARWMLRSYFFSYIAIRLFYSDFSGRRDEFSHQRDVTFPQWSNLNLDSILHLKQYEKYPFYNNTRRLYLHVATDSALLIALPNILNMNSEFVRQNQKYRDMAELNANLSKMLAAEVGGVWMPFSFDSIKNASWWIDDCHLNADGEKNKAEVLFPVLVRTLHQRLNAIK